MESAAEAGLSLLRLLPDFVTRAAVPNDIDAVTSIDFEREVDPAEVGVDADRLDRAWEATRALYRSGVHPAISICVRRHGRIVLNRALGHLSGNGPGHCNGEALVRATYETPFNIFSGSKAITAMVIHLLEQRGIVHLEDPVCEYIPEFGVKAKQWITIRHVLTHRAALPNLPPEALDLDHINDSGWITKHLCEAEVSGRPGRRLAYHAISGGFILGEIVRRATGRSIRDVLASEILEPLGFRWLNYGVAEEDVGLVARNYFTGTPVVPPVSTVLKRALGVSFEEVARLSNDSRFMTGVVPSANIITTADELSRFYQLLLNDGELDGVRIFERRTIRRAVMEQSYLEFDYTLGAPVRYGMGFFLGGEFLSLYGPDTARAFGHPGFTNILGWADPERMITVAVLTSGKPVFYPEVYQAWNIVRHVGAACPKVRELS